MEGRGWRDRDGGMAMDGWRWTDGVAGGLWQEELGKSGCGQEPASGAGGLGQGGGSRTAGTGAQGRACRGGWELPPAAGDAPGSVRLAGR